MKGERGFTLVEILIATAIMGLIISVLGTDIYHGVTIPEYGSDRMIAMHELQNAAHWVSLDGQMARTASGGNELVMTLPDDSLITYTVVGTKLRRTASDSQMTLARNITSANFSVENRIITMTITSDLGGRWDVSENGTYKVCLRPLEEE